jgi:hypothetical protein
MKTLRLGPLGDITAMTQNMIFPRIVMVSLARDMSIKITYTLRTYYRSKKIISFFGPKYTPAPQQCKSSC